MGVGGALRQTPLKKLTSLWPADKIAARMI